jgi:PAS domain S-box-containing protein
MPIRNLNNWRAPSMLVLIFVLLAAGIVTVGCRYYRNYERQFRAEAERQLSAIAELKADELAQYRKERLGDATSFFKNAVFSGLVRRFFEHPEDTEAQEQLRAWLDKYQTYYQYDCVFLLDAQGVERMSTPVTAVPVSAVVSRRVAEILRSQEIGFQDFHRHEHNQRIYLTLLVPILDESDANHPLGVLALRIDPETYLYPFIKRWPTPSLTGETLLVRRDGNDVLFLNDLKFQTNTALNLRISIENTNVPAVKAVLGQKGIVEGTDYRGVPSLAALQAIPDSPWFLVARMDTAEVYAPLRERLSLTILLVGLLLISAGLGIGAIWRHQIVRFYKERYQMAETLRDSEERFRRVFEEGPTGMAMLDDKFHFIRVNPAFASMMGYSEAELQKMAFTDITHPDHVEKDVEQVRRLMRGELARYHTEKRYITRSGKELWGQVQVAVVRNADGTFRYFLAIVGDITERKRSHEELEKRIAERTAELARERRLLRTLIDNLPDLVFVKDAQSRFVILNPACAQQLGASRPEEVLGRSDADFVSPELAAQYLADEQDLMRSGQVMQKEEPTQHKPSGDMGWSFTTKVPLRDDTGKIVGLMGIARDITKRKQTEEALRQAHDELEKRVAERTAELAGANANLQQQIAERERIEQVLDRERLLLRTLIDNLPDAIYAKDTASRKTMANPADLKNLRCKTEAEAIGKSDFDFFPKDIAEQFWADDQKVIQGEPVINQEEHFFDEAGWKRWLLTSKLPLRDRTGKIVGLVGIGRDITERKRAEEALAERTEEVFQRNQELAGANATLQQQIAVRERIEKVLEGDRNLLRTLIDSLPDYVYAKDAEGRFTIANEGVARQFGFSSPNEVIGKSDFDLFPPELAARYHADEEEILRSGQGLYSYEGPTMDASKQEKNRWVSTTKVPLRNDLGEITGFVGLGHDITERKRVEQELQQSSLELRGRNDELARFTYTVSHDLKSPLVTIKAFLGYLEQDTLNQDTEAIKKDRQYIYTAVDKMSRLLDELLDLARIGSKMNPPEEVPLQVVVKDALDMVAGGIIQKGVEVVVTKEPMMLCGDRTRLVEVFQNLVDNAIKFMGDQPAPRVEIGMEKTGEGNVFFVRDNGMGIEPRYQPKVFNLFEKYDPKMKGTGIGLALVKRIVEVHGGKIWVESAGIGKGATFRFTLAKIQPHPVQP